ncbi:tRNA-binding protein [Cytophaga hutchinsonii]|jgi:tRNA-binding protein|uniref:Methionine--tRNA ligase (Methionine tRNA synthetase) n=1 Tax=Cytophaga hutchinsonii (strain ATCC 33406 / DSM 1761 / CIP 103989 / NBRC 15051 / NCIMB 9469 / D465) TaxID=269798 RepID=A0A6N4SWS7_CYTH3|nr:tRNA-binding protein [Cytophaga hutchinsonii]ABG61017.1 methionine--tRNA ligase (methionine tRNA synthetase) [Cytophaga hutchinsonii ATCC 33406]SFX44436.1 tRNA-binding protein [Cytophaga hutchinsonii ATCC 33406]
MSESINNLSWQDFEKVDIRVGTITQAEIFSEAKKPAYKLYIDFGPLGIKKTSAQITVLYSTEELIGKQVVAVVNFPPKQIANIQSECLILGAIGGNKEITLLSLDKGVENGLRIG